MIIKHSQQNIEINIPPDITRVGLKISGGADSAITGWMLSMYVTAERPDIVIVPITIDQEGKAFQVQFAKRIIEFYKNTFGDIYVEHQTEFSPLPEDKNYAITQENLIKKLRSAGTIQYHFAGRTLNPPDDAIDSSVYEAGWTAPPDRVRDGTVRENGNGNRCLPLVNIDKRGVAELYKKFGLMETLFPLTRSCEEFTDDFSEHCGNCWFCAERKWGFGKL
jgi:7-cyano-7-deazaguanine synthase in queuosine biosynthesis